MTEQPDLSSITIDSLIDVAILSHGFMPYKRDYYFHIETLWNEPYAGQYLVLFRHCYEFNYRIKADSETIIESWDDCFIDWEAHQKAGEPQGYVWGTNWANAYPGFGLVQDSAKALDWSKRLNKEMQEVEVEAEIMKMNLIFHDWTIKKLNNETGLISQVLFPFL